MWSRMFENLRRRMTCIYAAIFGILILAIVAIAYTFIWWAILAHEKQELVDKIYHEAEEWVESGEKPCSAVSIQNGTMLAYFVTPDESTVILNQLGEGAQGRALLRHRNDWPKQLDTSRLLRMHGDPTEPGARYRYLAAVAPVMRGDVYEGKLYMFKNIEFYYSAAYKTLFSLLCVALVLFAGACGFGYWLAGRNIRPISEMYAKQKQFTADASHEMRTPLAVMKLAVEGMQEDNESRYSEFSQEYIKMLASETERMGRLTENLMTLAQNDEGIIQPQLEELDFTALAERVSVQLGLLAERKEIKLVQRIAPELNIHGNEQSLHRLMVILLDNAIKYSPGNTQITFCAFSKSSKLVLQVADQGCGISDEDKEKIFDRFFRVDKARSRSQGGLGLGLSLAQAIVRQHKGSIRVLDNKPCGTIMEVTLPL